MAEPLRVTIAGKPTGMLLKENGEFLFNYSDQAPKENFVSLTMPVRAKGYEHPRLHPIFEMNLPEGYLLSIIKKQFAKLTATDDLGLLQLLAPGVEGRIEYRQEIQTSYLIMPMF